MLIFKIYIAYLYINIYVYMFYVCFLYVCVCAGDWIQGLMHAKYILHNGCKTSLSSSVFQMHVIIEKHKGWGDASVDKELDVQAWRPEFTSQEPVQKKKKKSWVQWCGVSP